MQNASENKDSKELLTPVPSLAVAYVRVGTHHQHDSTENQMAAIKRYDDQHNIPLLNR